MWKQSYSEYVATKTSHMTHLLYWQILNNYGLGKIFPKQLQKNHTVSLEATKTTSLQTIDMPASGFQI